MSARKLRITLDREEVVSIIWAIDDLVEDYTQDGGLRLIERELRLREKLNTRLRKYDIGRRADTRPE